MGNFDKIKQMLEDRKAKSDSDMIGRIIGVVFGVYVVAYALVAAILALVNTTGFAANSPIAPIIQTLLPIIIVIGVGWMFYKHMAVK